MATVDRTLYKEVGRRIYNLRVENNYSRAYLAGQIHISPKFLYEIENGRKGFTVQVLVNLADVFGTTCDYLVRGLGALNSDLQIALYSALGQLNNEEQEKIVNALKTAFAGNGWAADECAAADGGTK